MKSFEPQYNPKLRKKLDELEKDIPRSSRRPEHTLNPHIPFNKFIQSPYFTNNTVFTQNGNYHHIMILRKNNKDFSFAGRHTSTSNSVGVSNQNSHIVTGNRMIHILQQGTPDKVVKRKLKQY